MKNFDIISNYNNEFNMYNIINNIKIKESEDNLESKNNLRKINMENNKDNTYKIKKEENKEKDEKKPKKKRIKKRLILKYGAFIIFALYVIKTIVSLSKGYISQEKIFNIFLILVIGLILASIQLRKA